MAGNTGSALDFRGAQTEIENEQPRETQPHRGGRKTIFVSPVIDRYARRRRYHDAAQPVDRLAQPDDRPLQLASDRAGLNREQDRLRHALYKSADELRQRQRHLLPLLRMQLIILLHP